MLITLGHRFGNFIGETVDESDAGSEAPDANAFVYDDVLEERASEGGQDVMQLDG